MDLLSTFPDGVWLGDTEFYPKNGIDGNLQIVLCCVFREYFSGQTIRLWQSDLKDLREAPFPVGDKALFVAFYSSAELNSFLSLGWPLPSNVLDLYVEFRRETNGIFLRHGNGLLGAMKHFGVTDSIAASEKEDMRDLILTRGPFTPEQQTAILDYCESDVLCLDKLLRVMADEINLPLALLSGKYMGCVSKIETTGIPVDLPLLNKLKSSWESIKSQLIASANQEYGVFEKDTFKYSLFEQYLIDSDIPWPRLKSGKLELKDETFREMAKIYPQISPLRELRDSLSKMRLSSLTVGEDGRNRFLLSPYSSITGRNQPSTSKNIFGSSVWMRGLIKPQPGHALAYLDWQQQEIGIAAALSGDEKMQMAYMSGDFYLAFAKQAGGVPPDATKESHKAIRDQFKQVALGVLYGMSAPSLAVRINQPVERAKQLLDLHHRTYREFWKFSDAASNEFALGGKLWTNYGWQIKADRVVKDRSIRNFPMQAHGSEMLRIACILMASENIHICCTIHDAVLIEAPSQEIRSTVQRAQELMAEASRLVLYGFALGTDVNEIQSPCRYMDDRGIAMWNLVMPLIGEPEYTH